MPVYFHGFICQELANFMGGQTVVSPEIKSNEVIFRVSAPYADTVRLVGSWMPADERVYMKKDNAAVWSVSIPVPAPELYTYSFNIDGLSVNDPMNIFQQRDGTRYLSVLLISGELTTNYFEAKQRGNLSQVWYESPTLGMARRLFVYTPYGRRQQDKISGIYLLHGLVRRDQEHHGTYLPDYG
jgi:enterochelin esterase family protein